MGTGTDMAVTVQGLHKAYGDVVAVEDVSFDLRRGEIFRLLGPNGSGAIVTVSPLVGVWRLRQE